MMLKNFIKCKKRILNRHCQVYFKFVIGKRILNRHCQVYFKFVIGKRILNRLLDLFFLNEILKD
ncbi:MAG: hypothetical protein ACRCZI_07315 [Cetobacterium sp.]